MLAELQSRLPDEIGGLSLSEVETWLQRQSTASDAMAALNASAQDLREAQADADSHRASLIRLLDGFGLAAPAHEDSHVLMTRVEGVVQREGKAEALRQAAAEARRQFKRRTDDLAEAERREIGWNAEFEAACSRTWLKSEGARQTSRRSVPSFHCSAS